MNARIASSDPRRVERPVETKIEQDRRVDHAKREATNPLNDVLSGKTQLARGDKGAEVAALQSLLNSWGAEPQLNVDGAFGPKTQSAVRAAQSRMGMNPDGVVGPETARALVEGKNEASPEAMRAIGNERSGSSTREAPPMPGERSSSTSTSRRGSRGESPNSNRDRRAEGGTSEQRASRAPRNAPRTALRERATEQHQPQRTQPQRAQQQPQQTQQTQRSEQRPQTQQQPATQTQQRPSTQTQPAQAQRQPATETQQPTQAQQQPATQTQRPATQTQQPATQTPAQQPASTQQQPAATQPQQQPASTQAQQPQPPQQPQRPAHDPARDAARLHHAMHGGLLGAGTDEDAIYQTLEGRTPNEIDAIRRSYADHYQGRNLDADLRSELNDSELGRAQALMRGDRSASSADALRDAMHGGIGAGTDEDAIYRTLEGASTPQERQAIEQSYRQRNGRELRADLRSELSGDELTRAEALLDGDRPRAEAARLHHAMRGGLTGLGTDEADIMQTLQNRSPQERAAIEQAYQRAYGTSLSSHMRDDMSGATLQRAEALRTGNDTASRAAQVREAIVGWGTDERSVEQALSGTTPDQRRAIDAEYRRMFGTDMASDIAARSSGTARAEADSLLARGQLSDAEYLHRAMNGAGTDEDGIRDVLGSRSRSEIEQIERDYQTRYGRSLRDDLSSETSGRDRFDVDMFMRGRADASTDEGLRDMVRRAEESRAFERDGAGNALGRGLVDTFSDSGRTLDANTRRAREALTAAEADGRIDDAERARIVELAGFAGDDVGAYRTSRDAATEAAGTAAATVAAVGITAVTMGAGAPVGATLVAATLTGGATRMAVTSAMQGNGATLEGNATAFATGSVDGLLVGVGGPLTGRAAQQMLQSGARRSVAQAIEREADDAAALVLRQTGDASRAAAARQQFVAQYPAERVGQMVQADLAATTATQRRLAFGGASAVEGSTGGAISSATTTALDDNTWRDGFAQGLERVGTSAGAGAVVGGVTGGTMGTAMGARAMRNSGQVDESRIWIDRGNGRRDYGDFEDFMRANRAMEPTPNVARTTVGGRDIEVNVYGARNSAEVARVQESVRRLAERVGPAQAQKLMREVHLRDVLGETPVDTSGRIGTIGGFASMYRNNGEVVLSRSVARDQSVLDNVLHHEVGHNFDGSMGIVSRRSDTIWGNGPSVTPYAQLDPAEDFAETFTFVSQNWDAIRADPARYYSMDTGPKIKAMVELMEGSR